MIVHLNFCTYQHILFENCNLYSCCFGFNDFETMTSYKVLKKNGIYIKLSIEGERLSP